MGNKAELEKLEIVLTWKLEPKVDTSGASRVDHDVKQGTTSNAANQGTNVGTGAVDTGVGTDQAFYDP